MLSAVFASILAIILIVRYYNNQLLKDKELLEKTVKERTQKIERQKDEIIENQQEIIRKNQEVRALKESQLQDKLRYKNKQLTTFTLNMLQKNEALKELRLKLMEGMRKNGKDSFTEYRKYLNLIDFSFRKDSEWDNFKLYFEEVYVGFFGNLLRTHPQLTTQDLRHCALIKLNLSISETAAILGISPDSVKTARFRLKQKMELDGDIGLTEYLMKT